MNKSFLKWAGGKFDLLPTLIPIIQQLPGRGGRYFEPFLGGGALALNIPLKVPKVLNDTNPGVVMVWECLRSVEFVEYVKEFFAANKTSERKFYSIRKHFNGDLAIGHHTWETAAMFLWLNRHCFNGLCRFNKVGEFNVPYGRYKTVYFPEAELLHASQVAQNIQILDLDFVDVMNMATQGDVVYCDPPYIPLSATSAFTTYSKGGFSIEQQWSLVARAERLRDRGVSVVISNNDTPLARKMYKNADKLKKVLVSKRISCKADGRKKSGELIAIYEP